LVAVEEAGAAADNSDATLAIGGPVEVESTETEESEGCQAEVLGEVENFTCGLALVNVSAKELIKVIGGYGPGREVQGSSTPVYSSLGENEAVVEFGDVWGNGECELAVVEDFSESELAGRPEVSGSPCVFEEVEALEGQESLAGKEERCTGGGEDEEERSKSISMPEAVAALGYGDGVYVLFGHELLLVLWGELGGSVEKPAGLFDLVSVCDSADGGETFDGDGLAVRRQVENNVEQDDAKCLDLFDESLEDWLWATSGGE
jgi:hypothetical protein